MSRAQEIMQHAERQMDGCEYAVLSGDVLSLTAQSACSAYDCEFVALAGNLEVPLITNDRQIVAAFPQTAITALSYLKNG